MQRPQPPPGKLVRLGVVVPAGPVTDHHRFARLCDLAGVDVVWVHDEQTAGALGPLARASVLVLPETDEPWARTVRVSIGRTSAEATARARLDPDFGEPELFGTLEEAQDAVAALVHQGVVDLRCVLPRTSDVHDLIAQLTSLAIGSSTTHRPDAARSPAPPPPSWARRPG